MARPRSAREFFEAFRPPGESKGKSIFPWRRDKTDAEAKPATGETAEKRDEPKPESPSGAPESAFPYPLPGVSPLAQDAQSAESQPLSDRPFAMAQGKIVITLSHGAFAAVIVVSLLLLALAFAAGNWRGSRSSEPSLSSHPVIPSATMPSKSQPTVVKIPSKKSRDTGIVRREVPSRPSAEGKEARPAPSPVAAPSGPPEAGGPYWTIQVVSGINPNKAEELRIALERQGYPNAVVKREGRYAAVRIGRFDSKDSPEALQFKKAISELKYEGRLQFQGCYFVKVE